MQPLTWTALEYEHRERSNDWFWSLGVVAFGGAVLAIILGNVLFALFIILGGVTLALYALRYPRPVTFQINEKGIVVGESLFPYETLESFDIHEHHRVPRLMVKSKKVVMPYLTVPLEEVTPDDVREVLTEHIPEENMPESLTEKLMTLFGF